MEHFSNRASKSTRPIHIVDKKSFPAFVKKKSKSAQAWAKARSFNGAPGKRLIVPARDGSIGEVWVSPKQKDVWALASLPKLLPTGSYKIETDMTDDDAERYCLGWALGTYSFDRYKERKKKPATLVWPAQADRKEITRLAEATFLVRDLITTPAGDMMPSVLAEAAKDLAKTYNANCKIIVGDDLLKKNYPAVHAVGRAADDAPRLVDITWGDAKDPKVTLVGKGVCFDSGGLDIKSAGGMLLMKKDMGGAAHVLGVAKMVMDAKLPVRLRVLVPCVENAIAGNAFRPMDILSTRKGISVEVGNTDAEGRLILCDTLFEATTEDPDMIIDFATLTGAARVAVGAELPALFCSDDGMAQDILDAGVAKDDPLWRLPLHRPYRRFLDSNIADINNISSTRYGGAITAALFLQEFVGTKIPWAHVDVMAYNQGDRAGRPKGGEAMGMRAMYAMLKRRFGS